MTIGSCFGCESCKSGQEQLCDSLKLAAIHSHGTFQEYCIVNATHAHRLPDEIDLAKAAPLHCAVCLSLLVNEKISGFRG